LFHIFRDCGSPLFFLKLIAIFILRTKFYVNKYVLWTLYCVVSLPAVEEAMQGALMQVAPRWILSLGHSSLPLAR
jgi:cell division protein FtsW (lipid II flippase)